MPPRRSHHEPEILSLRRLDRALLARQMLLRREAIAPVPAIERLGALQAQWPPAPYVGLWSRLEHFAIADLEKVLAARRVVKASLVRGTLHLVSARDYPAFAVAALSARRGLWPSTQRQLIRFFARQLPVVARYTKRGGGGIDDPERLHERLLRYAATPRSRESLVDLIAEHETLPRELATHLIWNFLAAYGMLVHVPESGSWASRRSGDLVAARAVLRGMHEPALADAVAHVVRRHLGAFGPATIDDVASWSSIRTPLIRAAIESLGTAVREFRDERGRVLFDLARAPRPPADTPAPVRFLPKWDSALLAYTPVERVRILAEPHRAKVIGKNGDIAQTFLVDGMVAGTWTLTAKPAEAVVRLEPLGRLSRADKAGLVEEGERLARFMAPEARAHGARV